jgi:hypothetical protein
MDPQPAPRPRLRIYASVSQPVYRGTLVCHELLLGVPPNIFLAYFSILLTFTFIDFCLMQKYEPLDVVCQIFGVKGVPQNFF